MTKHDFPANSGDLWTHGWFSSPREGSTVMENLFAMCALLSALFLVCFFPGFYGWFFPSVQQLWLVLFRVNIYVMEVSQGLHQCWGFITWELYIHRKENSFSCELLSKLTFLAYLPIPQCSKRQLHTISWDCHSTARYFLFPLVMIKFTTVNFARESGIRVTSEVGEGAWVVSLVNSSSLM